uniref:Uncharacterized protein ycf54 n=1 Tax=Paulinella chromatophora TaxID=39717 RepID=B1X5M2_PAUCH|nr:hypothetical protein PCC_0830 [Paulinella chromatophora]ACB43241.1 hypothetical protein PCC_0830 [Paulinella chromatophora]
MSTYYFVAASERFFTEIDRLEEVFQERVYNYTRSGKPIDFWLVKKPVFLNSGNFPLIADIVSSPAAAIVSTDSQFIEFMKLRLEFVVKGTLESNKQDFSDILARIE